MKVYDVFEGNRKIAEFIEFDDGFGFIHYTYSANPFPANEFSKAQSIKISCTKNNWSYNKIWDSEG